ncbi:FAD-dependent oxidoreductase [Xenophilus arseniciresistens]|uniref:FAD-dependent oxidoreductase n=1 Tax=Xenophilus arseniciresistens TaxID=1283306 RepID=A0AAE3SXF8_9BURK|nr:FAD-dependent oxidoreductase [Xenophilus arseniciresistens]MDA7414889.1 FAD-dependent oxidoreductase [Xenophilus arseniciresistens]
MRFDSSPTGNAPQPPQPGQGPLHVAVVGGGISGLSTAWLLSQRHSVTVFEAEGRPGGHSHTVDVPHAAAATGALPVDTGFIVYNEPAYPNLTALFAHLGVATRGSDMSFAVSLDQGRLEYAGTNLNGLFAQRSNLLRPRFWRMLAELLRFYREAPRDAAEAGMEALDAYLDRRGYGRAFREDHLYPMAAAIWSTGVGDIGRYPTEAFVRFCENHHLLQLSGRPQWRTVVGGSREYVRKLSAGFAHRLHLNSAVQEVQRDARGTRVRTAAGWHPDTFDAVVLACHADQALRLLPDASAQERRLLGAFGYSRNEAVLHSDPALMPRRRAVWASWNYLAQAGAQAGPPCVSYWMNRLQPLPPERALFLTLNPRLAPRAAHVIRTQTWEHPLFDAAALRAQRELWSLQGRQRTWFCGAYFGAGFHEDGLQSGLAVAEALGQVRRPWQVARESGRIHLGGSAAPALPAPEARA